MNVKQMMANPRIRDIFKKHLNALSRDLGQELTQPLLVDWGISREDVGLPEDVATTQPIVPASLIYDTKTRRWTCPRCREFSDLRRRSVTAHLRFCKAEPAPTPEPPHKKSRSSKTRT